MILNVINYIMAKGPLSVTIHQEDPLCSTIEALSNDEAVMRYRQAIEGVFLFQ